jgi:GAF domain-containing protein
MNFASVPWSIVADGRPAVGGVLAAQSQETLNRVTHLTSDLLNAPVACLWLVDAEDRLWVSSTGLIAPVAMMLAYPFCREMVASGRALAVADGREIATLAKSASVRDGMVTAYAGRPLVSASGRVVGSLFVIDPKARQWTTRELDMLEELAAVVMAD